MYRIALAACPHSGRMGENGNSAAASTRPVPPLYTTPLPSDLRADSACAAHCAYG